MKRIIYAVFGLSFLGLVLPALADDGIKEGNWEVTTTLDPNSKQGIDDAQAEEKETITKCVTNADPVPDIHKFAQEFTGCVPPQVKKDGGTVDYSISCNGDTGKIDVTGHLVFTDETMQGQASMDAQIKGQESNISTHLSGKYVGPCS